MGAPVCAGAPTSRSAWAKAGAPMQPIFTLPLTSPCRRPYVRDADLQVGIKQLHLFLFPLTSPAGWKAGAPMPARPCRRARVCGTADLQVGMINNSTLIFISPYLPLPAGKPALPCQRSKVNLNRILQQPHMTQAFSFLIVPGICSYKITVIDDSNRMVY